MHYRDLIVTAIAFGSLPYILRRPHIGILVFAWLSYMNPHRLCWGFAYDFPFALIVAVTTLVSLLISKEPKRFPLTGLTLIWLLLLAWYTCTTVFAAFPEHAWPKYERVLKIHVMTMASVMLITSKDRIHQLLWVILLSIGFYGFKGGIFTISTGGSFRVWGPPGSDIEDNNHLAIALLMMCPLAYYLRSISTQIWLRRGLLISMGLFVVSAIGSQSRGALLASLSFGGYLWTKSKGKIVSAILIIVAGVLIFNFMPLSWHERMGTIKTYQQDGSA
ncbi:MAG: putative O-glycosylation ligase, exosortase A system-associated, partial [Gammaproteobacteria bacterium]